MGPGHPLLVFLRVTRKVETEDHEQRSEVVFGPGAGVGPFDGGGVVLEVS